MAADDKDPTIAAEATTTTTTTTSDNAPNKHDDATNVITKTIIIIMRTHPSTITIQEILFVVYYLLAFLCILLFDSFHVWTLLQGTSIAQLRSSIPNVEELEDTPLKCIINVYTQWGKTVDPLIAYTSTESESSAASSSSYLFLQGTALLNVLFVAPTHLVMAYAVIRGRQRRNPFRFLGLIHAALMLYSSALHLCLSTFAWLRMSNNSDSSRIAAIHRGLENIIAFKIVFIVFPLAILAHLAPQSSSDHYYQQSSAKSRFTAALLRSCRNGILALCLAVFALYVYDWIANNFALLQGKLPQWRTPLIEFVKRIIAKVAPFVASISAIAITATRPPNHHHHQQQQVPSSPVVGDGDATTTATTTTDAAAAAAGGGGDAPQPIINLNNE